MLKKIWLWKFKENKEKHIEEEVKRLEKKAETNVWVMLEAGDYEQALNDLL